LEGLKRQAGIIMWRLCSTFLLVLPLPLALYKIQMMISLQLVQALAFLVRREIGGGVFICPCCGNSKILDFLGDYDEEDMSFLVVEELLIRVEDIETN
jgi:hypothetical protein